MDRAVRTRSYTVMAASCSVPGARAACNAFRRMSKASVKSLIAVPAMAVSSWLKPHRSSAPTFGIALLCALCLGALGPALDHAAALQERIDQQSQAAHAAAQQRAQARQRQAAVALCLAERGAGAVATWPDASQPTTITCSTRTVRGR